MCYSATTDELSEKEAIERGQTSDERESERERKAEKREKKRETMDAMMCVFVCGGDTRCSSFFSSL